MSIEPNFLPIDEAIARFRDGSFVIIVDHHDRENEGDLAIAAETVTAEAVNFMVRFGRGLVCVAVAAERCDALELPLMVPQAANQAPHGTAFTVSVEARGEVSTGISAADRAATIRALADPATRPGDLLRPGHVFPLRAHPHGVLGRTGQTEASVDLARLAGLASAAAICEIMNEDGTMARIPDLARFAARHGVPLVRVEDLVRYRREREGREATALPAEAQPGYGEAEAPQKLQVVARPRLPTSWGEFRLWAFRCPAAGEEHLALVMGDVGTGDGTADPPPQEQRSALDPTRGSLPALDPTRGSLPALDPTRGSLPALDPTRGSLPALDPALARPPLVRIHSSCLTGDVFGSTRCDCGLQLTGALERIAAEGRGVLLYLLQEGRGIGLINKLKAYELQEDGHDTVEANEKLGFAADERDYRLAARILRHLGVTRLRLLTNNPGKQAALAACGLAVVERVPLELAVEGPARDYMRAKREKLGHLLKLV